MIGEKLDLRYLLFISEYKWRRHHKRTEVGLIYIFIEDNSKDVNEFVHGIIVKTPEDKELRVRKEEGRDSCCPVCQRGDRVSPSG